MHYTIIGLTFLVFAATQSIISLFIPGAAPQKLIAFIVGSDTTATTYAVDCIPLLPQQSSLCGSNALILTAGPSSVGYILTTPGLTEFVGCTLTGSPATAGICTSSTYQSDQQGTIITTLAASDIVFQNVSILSIPGPAATPASTTGSASSSPRPASTSVSLAPVTSASAGYGSDAGGTVTSGLGSASQTTTNAVQTGVASVSQSTAGPGSSTVGAHKAGGIKREPHWAFGGVAAAAALFFM